MSQLSYHEGKAKTDETFRKVLDSAVGKRLTYAQVIEMEKNQDKSAEKERRAKKPPGFRRFKKLLKQVISAPPLRPKSRVTVPSR